MSRNLIVSSAAFERFTRHSGHMVTHRVETAAELLDPLACNSQRGVGVQRLGRPPATPRESPSVARLEDRQASATEERPGLVDDALLPREQAGVVQDHLAGASPGRRAVALGEHLEVASHRHVKVVEQPRIDAAEHVRGVWIDRDHVPYPVCAQQLVHAPSVAAIQRAGPTSQRHPVSLGHHGQGLDRRSRQPSRCTS